LFDLIGGSKPLHGWLKHFVHADLGLHKMRVIEFAAFAAIAIAVFDALCSYVQTYMTSSVGQWVTRDLRSTLYEHIQHLPLAYHKQSRTGDFLSRLTTDIDAVQSRPTRLRAAVSRRLAKFEKNRGSSNYVVNDLGATSPLPASPFHSSERKVIFASTHVQNSLSAFTVIMGTSMFQRVPAFDF